MPKATFVVQLDDLHGFVVKHRHPSSLTLNERTLNLLFYEQQKSAREELSYAEIEGLKFVTYSSPDYPGAMVCYILGPEETPADIRTETAGSGRLILALMKEDPDAVNLAEILKSGKTLMGLVDEQRYAEIFLTPSSALLLERMQSEGIERSAKLSIWLKSQTQSDEVDIKEAMDPLMKSGVVRVELIGKTAETVFLIRDLFGYREPPVDSVAKAIEMMPSMAKKYRDYVAEFFSPPPPHKGYNPTILVDNPNSPMVQDRESIARFLSERLYFMVLECLREQPLSAAQISEKTALSEEAVMKLLWSLESEKVVIRFEEEDVWALLTNPRIKAFMPEYLLPVVSRKMSQKEISPEAARRHLELLIETWGEQSD